MPEIKIKICCISSLEEANVALAKGANALGLVSEMPSGPGIITESLIAEIIRSLPDTINTFLLTSKPDIRSIIAQYNRLKPQTIQLVDALKDGSLKDLKEALPDANLVQVVHVLDESSIDYALNCSLHADALLLDSGNPNLKVKTLGGTGKTHNWEISRKIVEAVEKPVWLAGGLRAGNVKTAIDLVQPYGLDLCSGVRTNGQLDPDKLEDFVQAVRG